MEVTLTSLRNEKYVGTAYQVFTARNWREKSVASHAHNRNM